MIFKLTELSRTVLIRQYIDFKFLNKAADGGFLDLYLKAFSRKFYL